MEFFSSGCTNSWAEMKGGTCVFECKGCKKVARLVQEVEDLRQIMEAMKRMVYGTGIGRKRRTNGGSSGTTGRGEGRVSVDTRQE